MMYHGLHRYLHSRKDERDLLLEADKRVQSEVATHVVNAGHPCRRFFSCPALAVKKGGEHGGGCQPGTDALTTWAVTNLDLLGRAPGSWSLESSRLDSPLAAHPLTTIPSSITLGINIQQTARRPPISCCIPLQCAAVRSPARLSNSSIDIDTQPRGNRDQTTPQTALSQVGCITCSAPVGNSLPLFRLPIASLSTPHAIPAALPSALPKPRPGFLTSTNKHTTKINIITPDSWHIPRFFQPLDTPTTAAHHG